MTGRHSRFANFEQDEHAKPVDTVVASKLVSTAIYGTTFQGLAEAFGISTSEAHEASNRLVKAGLFKAQERRVPCPNKRALPEFWVHGLKYVYPAETGARGYHSRRRDTERPLTWAANR